MTTQRISYQARNTVIEGKDDMLARVIETAIRDINYTEEQITAGIGSLVRHAEQVQHNLDRGYGLNELGEFQTRTVDIDRHIATRHQAWQTLGLVLSENDLKVLREGYTA